LTHEQRKREHLRIFLEEDARFKEVSTGLEGYRFLHQALPEIDREEIDLSSHAFGKRLARPFLISSMTGGTEEALAINRNLARAAQTLGIAMGVGSQRAAIEDLSLAHTYQVRDVAPDILLFANLGAVQLNYGYGLAECQRAVDMIGANGLILHLNPLQEALQVGGNTNFSGLVAKIQAICQGLSVPVVVKEVGWGISEEVAGKLAAAGVAGIDVAGAGGTSWGEVEGRLGPDQTLAEAFAEWGIPTTLSIQLARRAAPQVLIIASGGIRSGLDAAKAIALGADLVGLAAPLLKAAATSSEAVVERIEKVAEGLRTAMFCIGVPKLGELKGTKYLYRI